MGSVAYGDLLVAPKATLNIIKGTCFAAGTPVLTPDGTRFIEDLKIGDKVLSRPENDQFAAVRVQDLEKVFELSSGILEVRLGGQTIETTAEHPFFVSEKGWVRAANLESGDIVIGHNDQKTPIESVTTTSREEAVYNLRVSEDHTYFVENIKRCHPPFVLEDSTFSELQITQCLPAGMHAGLMAKFGGRKCSHRIGQSN